jgi:hypothetical protein
MSGVFGERALPPGNSDDIDLRMVFSPLSGVNYNRSVTGRLMPKGLT